ncbi:hypothetical protein SAY86_027009 [Trapa natans]|uniref:Sodium transporter HKT1 n=1 Tax=Trapa natans TaxID=22666 RepID=A0AAN7QIL7_TRANT|nr:hypothetical protein SAY86_027009 [Trapa natans]
MICLSHICREMQFLCNVSWVKLGCLFTSTRFLSLRFYRFVLLRTNSFLLQILYFIALSSIGFWLLGILKQREPARNLDLFFTSVSAATVSSMSTVEMEAFSNAQLVVLTVLMFVGGEVFTSMVGLYLRSCRLRLLLKKADKVASVDSDGSVRSTNQADEDVVVEQIELGLSQMSRSFGPDHFDYLRYISIKFLASVVLVYQVAVQAVGVAMVSIYFKLVSRSRKVLKDKGLKLLTFSVFTTVSTFASCGFVPTNENMIVFGRDSFLLLILIPQVLLGNTLFPSCLRLILWGLDRWCTSHGDIPSYLLRNSREIGYLHLLPGLHSRLLVVTVFAFIGVQFALFCAMQWSSSVLSGLSSSYEKIVAVLFQCVNTRHTGETVVDLSQLAPAILVLFVVMMYLPPYTSFLPVKGGVGGRRSPEAGRANEPIRIRGEVVENLIFSQLSYLAMFVILVCITERQSMKKDPLNFNVLSIVVEVISAYGNVGFTMGYSCARQLHPDAACTDKWFGFVGKWTDGGKVVLIAVMIFGRLKKFNMNGGRGWKLL